LGNPFLVGHHQDTVGKPEQQTSISSFTGKVTLIDTINTIAEGNASEAFRNNIPLRIGLNAM